MAVVGDQLAVIQDGRCSTKRCKQDPCSVEVRLAQPYDPRYQSSAKPFGYSIEY